MPDESRTTTNGADAIADSGGTAKKRVAKAASKKRAKSKTAKKGAARKNGGRKTTKRSAAKKKTSSNGSPATEKKKGGPGKPPTASLRFLLLEEKHKGEGKSAAEIARMVACSQNQITKVRENEARYKKMIAEMSEEERQRLLTTFIPKQTRGGKKPNRAVENGARPPQGASAADGDERAVFRRALRLVGLARARQLLDEFEKEE